MDLIFSSKSLVIFGVFFYIKNLPASSKNSLLCYKKFGYDKDNEENNFDQQLNIYLFEINPLIILRYLN